MTCPVLWLMVTGGVTVTENICELDSSEQNLPERMQN